MIYIASPFFNEEELSVLKQVEEILQEKGFDIFSPRQHEVLEYEPGTSEWSRAAFCMDREAIDRCDLVVMIYHGNYSDSGTAWECGYASAKGKPVVAVHLGDSSNIMIHESVIANLSLDELSDYDFQGLEEKRYTGKMY